MLALSEIGGIESELVNHESFIGGGSLPTERQPSYAVRVAANGYTVDALAGALRRGEPSVFGRIVGNTFLIDCRTLQDFDVADVALALSRMDRVVQ